VSARAFVFVLAASTSLLAGASELRRPESFSSIAARDQRAAALFTEAGKVLLHPRCVNCHPATDRPRQGDDGHPHEPRVRRGSGGRGVTTMRCATCHGAANYDAVGMPGHTRWAVAPASMAWEGRSLREICEQVKDPTRNGGRRLDAIVEHVRSDSLVGWAWAPGAGRQPAPGTQAAFGALIEAWVRAGAACPAP
jgi:hypothetical protein